MIICTKIIRSSFTVFFATGFPFERFFAKQCLQPSSLHEVGQSGWSKWFPKEEYYPMGPCPLEQAADPGRLFWKSIMSKNVPPVACRSFWMIMIICKNRADDDDAKDADDDDVKDAHDDVGSLRWNDGGRAAGVKTREDFYCNTLPSTSLFTPRNALKQNIIIIIVLLCLYWPITIWEHQKRRKGPTTVFWSHETFTL